MQTNLDTTEARKKITASVTLWIENVFKDAINLMPVSFTFFFFSILWFLGERYKTNKINKFPFQRTISNRYPLQNVKKTELFCKISTTRTPQTSFVMSGLNAQQVSTGSVSSHLRVFNSPPQLRRAAHALLCRLARRLSKLPESFLRGGLSLAKHASRLGLGGGSEKTGPPLDGGIYVGSGRGWRWH